MSDLNDLKFGILGKQASPVRQAGVNILPAYRLLNPSQMGEQVLFNTLPMGYGKLEPYVSNKLCTMIILVGRL